MTPTASRIATPSPLPGLPSERRPGRDRSQRSAAPAYYTMASSLPRSHATHRMNVVKQIRQFNAGRDPEPLAVKYRAMRSDPFVFLRATCHLFYARLPDASVMRNAPPAWCSGDLHLENFGSYKGDDDQVYFDINDFDEALLAPATWDLVRCLSSILVGRHHLQPGAGSNAQAVRLCEVFLERYGRALIDGKARWVEREIAPSPVRELLEDVHRRERGAFLDTRTVKRGRRRLIRIDGQRALAATKQQRAQVLELFGGLAARPAEPRFFEVLDVARRVAGTGSLGLERLCVLVRGKGSPDGNFLLDLKQAPALAVRARAPLAQPKWRDDATRIVRVQERMQAVSMALLQPVKLGDRPCVLRVLQPSEDRLDMVASRHPAARLENIAAIAGKCVAWAQLRSSGREGSANADDLMAFAAGATWQRKLIALARHCADQVESDWKVFAQACDDAAFAP